LEIIVKARNGVFVVGSLLCAVLAFFPLYDSDSQGQETKPKKAAPVLHQESVRLLARAYGLAVMGRENRWPEALVLAARMLRHAEVEFDRDPAPFKTVQPGKKTDGPEPSFSAEQPNAEADHLLEDAFRISRGTGAEAGIESLVAAVKKIPSMPKISIRQFRGILKPEQRNVYTVPVEKGRSTLVYFRGSRFDVPVDVRIQDGGSTYISAKRPYTAIFAYPIIEYSATNSELTIAISNPGTAATAYQLIVR